MHFSYSIKIKHFILWEKRWLIQEEGATGRNEKMGKQGFGASSVSIIDLQMWRAVREQTHWEPVFLIVVARVFFLSLEYNCIISPLPFLSPTPLKFIASFPLLLLYILRLISSDGTILRLLHSYGTINQWMWRSYFFFPFSNPFLIVNLLNPPMSLQNCLNCPRILA